ncbi:MAG: hypothetical protein AAF202_12475, partial [Pseudomonadota bacterium]
FPTSLKALPMAINGAVIAHEHFHGHFNSFQLRTVSIESPYQEFNDQVILRGWNEGLADFYAYAYTGHDDFISISVPFDGTRLLSADPTVIRPTSDLRITFNRYMALGRRDVSIERRRERVLGCLSYPLGTQLAVLLYHISQLQEPKGGVAGARVVLKHVMKRLEDYQPVLAQTEDSLGSTDLLRFIFEGQDFLSEAQQELYDEVVITDASVISRDDWKEAYPCER